MDRAEDKDVQKRSLFVLPPQFRINRAFSFNIHLIQIPDDTVANIPVDSIWKHLKKQRYSLSLVPQGMGKVVVKFGFSSLPGDIRWRETVDGEDPFAPAMEKHVTLSQCLYSEGFVLFKESFNNSIEVDVEYFDDDQEPFSDENKKEELEHASFFKSTESIKSENESSMPTVQTRWNNPVLPADREFLARGTHVDNAGQIYMHLFEDRHKFNNLRRTLNRHYELSLPDCDIDSFEPGQEVIAKWQESQEFNEEWYRARFLGYQPRTKNEVCWVYFVDWGNISEMETINLRKELIETKTPIFAFKTVLFDVLSFDRKDWTNDALSFVHGKINYDNKKIRGGRNIVRVRTMSRTGKQPLFVDIQLSTPYNESEKGHQGKVYISVSELLLKRGDAVKATITEVNSKDQRTLRKKHDFGVRYDKKVSKEHNNNQAKQKHIPDSQIPLDVFERIEPFKTSLFGFGNRPYVIVDCQVQAFLFWNQLSVHILSKNKAQSKYEDLKRALNLEVKESAVITWPRYVEF